jgi:hypothetical protein
MRLYASYRLAKAGQQKTIARSVSSDWVRGSCQILEAIGLSSGPFVALKKQQTTGLSREAPPQKPLLAPFLVALLTFSLLMRLYLRQEGRRSQGSMPQRKTRKLAAPITGKGFNMASTLKDAIRPSHTTNPQTPHSPKSKKQTKPQSPQRKVATYP